MNSREYWQDDLVEMFRLPDGTFPRYQHGSRGEGTIHGDQYMAPWWGYMPHQYVVDDFGDWHAPSSAAYAHLSPCDGDAH